MPGGDMLLMDAPETIERFLQGGESDLGTRRNAFLMLYNNAQERAVNFLMANLEQVANWGDILQNVVLDLIRKVRIVFTLFRSILLPERPKRVCFSTRPLA
jgi:coatomer subunit beta